MGSQSLDSNVVTANWPKLDVAACKDQERHGLYPIKYCSGDQIKEYEMGGVWHVWGKTDMHAEFLLGNLRERFTRKT